MRFAMLLLNQCKSILNLIKLIDKKIQNKFYFVFCIHVIKYDNTI